MYLHTRLSCCLKCKKKTESENRRVERVVVKARDLSNSKKLIGYEMA